MKKRGIVFGLIMMLLMTGCTKNPVNIPANTATGTSEIPNTNPSNSENPSSIFLEEGEQIAQGAVVFSHSCGYLGSDFVPDQYILYLISNEEELAYAEIYLGMAVPENVEEIIGFNNGLADAFQKMKEDYPITDYNYLLEYLEYSQGGHYHHADSVIYKEDKIYFHYDVVKEPEGEFGTDVMDGDLIMAAVPKTVFEGKKFVNVARYGIPLVADGETIAADNEVKEGYIAIFGNGNPDFVKETFVYKTEDGYKCLHSHSAYILGDAKWDRHIEFYRITPAKEGVIGAVQEFGSYDTVRYPGDEKYYKADDFTNKVFE
ncbi:MAG: hypothetical protein IKP92_04530 [Lachnospiraceae bacterium]|nr:hypothetical protein [Lachnospiraceae bacterium]